MPRLLPEILTFQSCVLGSFNFIHCWFSLALRWGTADEEIKLPSVEYLEPVKVLAVKPRIGQKGALRVKVRSVEHPEPVRVLAVKPGIGQKWSSDKHK